MHLTFHSREVRGRRYDLVNWIDRPVASGVAGPLEVGGTPGE